MIQGLRTTLNFAADERPKNWREGILLRYPNGKAPLTALTSAMKSRSVDDPEFNWWEKEISSRRVALSANAGTGTSLSVVEKATQFKDGDVLMAEHTGELMLVAADPSSATALTVIRGYGTVAATDIDFDGAGVNPYLTCIGSAYEEGSLAPTGVNLDPTKRYNYTEIFRNTLEATRTAMKTRLRTGDQVREAKRECLELHSIDMEKALWFGQRKETTRNGKPLRMMDGVFAQIDSGNVAVATSDHASGVTFEDLENYLERAFRYGSSEKMAFCGNTAALTIQRIIRGARGVSWTFTGAQKEFGMNVSRLVTPFGEVVFKTHPLWNMMRGGTTSGTAYAGVDSWFAILDMDDLQYVYLKDSDTKYEPNLQANGMDGVQSGYITECSVEVHHPVNHFLIKNLTTAAVEPQETIDVTP